MVVVVMLAVATAVFAELPRPGVYETTDTQFEYIGGDLWPLNEPVAKFRIDFTNESEVRLRWDYDDDGELADEPVEEYPYIMDEDGARFRDNDNVVFFLWYSKASGFHTVSVWFAESTYIFNLQPVSSHQSSVDET
jgi:hypothetical protein